MVRKGSPVGRWVATVSLQAPKTDGRDPTPDRDRKSTRLNSSHMSISYAVFCLKKKKHTPRAASTRTSTLGGPSRTSRRNITKLGTTHHTERRDADQPRRTSPTTRRCTLQRPAS